MKNIKKVTLLLLVLSSAPAIQASPLKRWLPSITRSPIAWKLGNDIKAVAAKYGISCQYPVVALSSKKAHTENACADTWIDKETGKARNKRIIYEKDLVRKELARNNAILLAAILPHEIHHLDADHRAKTVAFGKKFMLYTNTKLKQLKDAHLEQLKKEKKPTEEKFSAFIKELDEIQKKLLQEFHSQRLALSRKHEEEADAAIKHPDLCQALCSDFRNNYIIHDTAHILNTLNMPQNNETIEQYQRACAGSKKDYEMLEQGRTHPLAGRRASYLQQYAIQLMQNEIKAVVKKELPYLPNFLIQWLVKYHMPKV